LNAVVKFITHLAMNIEQRDRSSKWLASTT